MEEWKDIKGYEGLYQVSSLGRVKSLNYNKTGKEHLLNPGKVGGGYLMFVLSKGGKRSNLLLHRLVAEAFIPNPDNLPCVNHKNEDKSDNRVENLEWCTHKYNNNYGSHNTLIGLSNSKAIYQYTIDGLFVKKWISPYEVERQLGFSNTAIRNCALGYSKSSFGYKWCY